MLPHALRSDVGKRRKNNEDAVLADPRHGLYVVADGVGGQAAGERASALTVETFLERGPALHKLALRYAANPGQGTRVAVLEALEDLCAKCSQRVFEMGDAEGFRGSSTTVVASLVAGGAVFLAHVGDSRAYLLRNGRLHQLTDDHTLVNEMVRRGELTREQARRDRRRNIITRAVGALPTVQADVLAIESLPGDRVLLCSDGLSDPVPGAQIQLLLGQPDPEEAAESLLQQALDNGGPDNVTLLLFDPPVAGEPDAVAARARLLAELFLFRDLPMSARMRVGRMVRQLEVEAGTIVVDQGAPGRTLYAVVHGDLVVEKDGVELAHLGPGEHFGELSLVDSRPRSARVRAINKTSLIAIDRQDLVRFCLRDPDLGNRVLWALLGCLSGRMRAANERVTSSEDVAALNQAGPSETSAVVVEVEPDFG
jgi:serine/threonine protein phosphatase PrpC/CRP-like cAMP-binding protein